MIKCVKTSSLIFVLALLPASASALTITISAPNNTATTLDLTMTGEITLVGEKYHLRWIDIGDYVKTDTLNTDKFDLTSGITANGNPVTEIEIDMDTAHPDDFELYHSFDGGNYIFSGSATFNLLDAGPFTFGDLNIGTYSLDTHEYYGNVADTGHSLVIQYSSVPDTGATAALLGVGVTALAFARRRLG